MFLLQAERLRLEGERRKQEAGKQYGKGRPKLQQNSAEANKPAPQTRDQIAAKAGTSRYKAEQALIIETALTQFQVKAKGVITSAEHADQLFLATPSLAVTSSTVVGVGRGPCQCGS